MKDRRSPTIRLLAGLAVTLSAVAVYSAYNFVQLRHLEDLQTSTIDRNRMDSLLLLRIQRNMNDLALTMRDMLESSEPYPLTAWQGPIRRIRTDLTDALDQEAKYSPLDRGADQRKQSPRATSFSSGTRSTGCSRWPLRARKPKRATWCGTRSKPGRRRSARRWPACWCPITRPSRKPASACAAYTCASSATSIGSWPPCWCSSRSRVSI